MSMSSDEVIRNLQIAEMSRLHPKLKAFTARAMRLLEDEAVLVAVDEAKIAEAKAEKEAEAAAKVAEKKQAEAKAEADKQAALELKSKEKDDASRHPPRVWPGLTEQSESNGDKRRPV